MKAPLSWLKDYVDIDISVQELEEKLFSGGLEVEELIYLGKEITNCVVGEITAIEKHQDSDHLQICKLNCSEKYGTDIQIVTGADNIFVGAKVPVALDGSTLANGIKIKKGKLRGVESNGMLCSGEELGINDDWYKGAEVYGILILDPETPVGEDIVKVVGLDDYVFDISITANRPDCQSIVGIAREIAAILNKPFREPALDYTPDEKANDDEISVKVEAKDICPRYIGHYVKDVKIGESPAWMRKRLALCGINSISNMVDITNFILLELGQPMHAFDMATLSGKSVLVRRAKKDEKIITLDEKEFKLNENNLVICDSEKPVALAGIMGGLNSEIKDNTQNVLFESAKFARDNVRKTSRSLGQASDSSAKFGKGVDEYTTEMAMKRALHLVEKLGCGVVSGTHFDERDKAELTPCVIRTTTDKINKVLGIVVPEEVIFDILKRLNFTVEKDGEEIVVTPPLYREDVFSYEDLAEEVIRIYGYEHIKPTMLSGAAITRGGLNLDQQMELKAKKALVMQGGYEIVTYSFCSPKDLDMLKLEKDAPERNVVAITNPISEHYSIMCPTLAANMIHIIVNNFKKGNDGGRFFELGHRFVPTDTPRPEEIATLCLGIYGEKESFFTLKGMLEGLAEEFNLSFAFEKAQKPFLHPGITANILCNGKEIGYMGRLSHELSEELSLGRDAFVAELNYEVLKNEFKNTMKYQPISEFPSVVRDFALISDESVTCGEIIEVMKKANKNITEVKLFDIYRGKQIADNKKSMAFTVTFTPTDQPISQKEIDRATDKILKDLKFKLNIELR